MRLRFLWTAALAIASAARAQEVVNPADVADHYFTAANGFETRVIHPKWEGDRLVVEDIRFRGNYPLIAATLPADAAGAGAYHPAAMVGGILTYEARALFGPNQPQTVVFKHTQGPATGGIHAIVTFGGPPEGPPTTVEAVTRTTSEWQAGQHATTGDPGRHPG